MNQKFIKYYDLMCKKQKRELNQNNKVKKRVIKKVRKVR